ncbi:MAG: Crp/Fnr family transcriptional regulator [Sphingobacteriaceae bacterium]|nr:MAG: Crp/Fnr family transcriptional regulator [Sphingobacteriaceae bacterium]
MKQHNNVPTPHEARKLQEVVNTIPVLSDEFFKDMLPGWSAVNVKRKEELTTTGETEQYLYFTTEGIQRCYCVHGDREATIVFTYPYSFAGVVDSFLLQKPSLLNFEALTAGRLLRISYTHLISLAELHPAFEKWLRIMLSNVLSGLLVRQKELSMFSASEKLEALFARSPHIFNLIPDKYIASYIGVDPATLSKMMNSIKL